MKASDKIASKLPAEKPRKAPRRKPGLLHGPRAIEVEDVSVRMKRPCSMCAKDPSVRRVVVTSGGGRYAKVEVYCIKCGAEFLARAEREYHRSISFLLFGHVAHDDADRTDPADKHFIRV